MTENSFKAYDYEMAQKSFRIWQAEQAKEIDDYLLRQRKSDLNKLIKRVIENELDEKDQTLVKLSWYEGMSKDQIAQMLGVSRSSVFRRLEKITEVIYEKLKYAVEYRYGSKEFCTAPVLVKSCVVSVSHDSLNSIGGRLKQLRTTQYLSASDVAASTGIGIRRIREIEKSGKSITMLELKKLAVFYRVQTDYILFGSRRVLRDPLTGMPINHNCEEERT